MAETVKICSECAHCNKAYEAQLPLHIFELYYCTRNQIKNIVSGKLEGKLLNCKAEREDALRLEQERCCAKGRFYKAKYINIVKNKTHNPHIELCGGLQSMGGCQCQ